jgi:curli production assembly/transport component CsgE
MKDLFVIFFFLFATNAIAQVDTISMKYIKTDSLSNYKIPGDTSKVIKDAPEVLKDLFENIIKEETRKFNKGYDLEIDGLIIDQTKTKSGREFYDYFFRDWEPPKGASNYTIYIEEKPFRLNTTFIEILINETLIYQSFLQPRSEFLENLAQESIATTQMYLANYEELLRQLGGNDVKGTGIF